MSNQYKMTRRAIAEHVGRTYQSGSTVKAFIEEMTEQVLKAPITPDAPNALEQRIWEMEVDEYVKQKNILTMNLKTLYSLIWGQAAPALRAKLRKYAVFNRINAECDFLALVTIIRTVCFSDSDNKYKYQSNNEIIRKFYMLKQDRNMPNAIYFEKYNNLLEVPRNQGVNIGCEPGTIKHRLNNLELLVNKINDTSADKLEEAKFQARVNT